MSSAISSFLQSNRHARAFFLFYFSHFTPEPHQLHLFYKRANVSLFYGETL
uniref:Uncharacterized protein n=1 Tax=Arundo donax TaxID=35708 RepID=A0A0A9CBG8_ARUDO